jgi:hypothetical protein
MKVFKHLSASEKDMVLQCMLTILKSPYVDDFEFQTRLGVERNQVGEVIAAYPEIDDSIEDSIMSLSIENSLNEICHGINIPQAEWEKWFDYSKEEIRETYQKWKRLKSASKPQES